MENTPLILIFITSFLIVALASKQIGAFFARYNLPLISGFLFAGVLVGPFVLDMIPSEAIGKLRFVDEISLGFIAFAAGSELYLKDLRGRLKGIAWVTIGQIFFTLLFGSISVYYLLSFIPFMATLPSTSRVAASIMAAAILVARSPSSAIAIINELRAKGPFTQTILGVTVITDVAVIIIFAISSESAGALLSQLPINIGFAALLIGELLVSMLLGFLLGKFIGFILSLNLRTLSKSIIVLALGYSVFVASALVRIYSHALLHIEFLLEPLLIAMIASFYITNWTRHRDQMLDILEEVSPAIYIAFFTLTGASLALDVLSQVWGIALALFLIRLLTIFIGSLSGGLIAREPMQHNMLSWMAYITQAGVGLGLAKEMAVEFPSFGESFATLIIAVIVLNQIVGPPLFKWVIHRVNEAHTRGETSFDGTRDALIFGTDDQALAVARLLKSQNWNIKWVCTDSSCAMAPMKEDEPLTVIPRLSFESLEKIDASKADSVVAMLSDEENYRLCELFYENYGTETLVVRLNDLANREPFQKLDVLTVHPGTATVQLLDQFARKPDTASLLMDTESKFKIREYSLRDPNLHGVALRDLRLPTDTLIVAIHRNGNDIVSHGYTRLRLGDKVTVIGSPENLDEILLKFEL
ncbi:MAG: potassium transporter TrkA [Anaerolineae bacterium]|jgi:Trk K+ transport system NAD-binding subunit/Kef-type K+ transport system membrane component KefB|nr:potassium transporter TrkA [Anaerolineae bacterium]MBT7070148.1 potassium transporter TrkA [Anaerolineae bacterium]MBT7326198.1 potassium transporter TrkA [Anaerolineae bacterium]